MLIVAALVACSSPERETPQAAGHPGEPRGPGGGHPGPPGGPPGGPGGPPGGAPRTTPPEPADPATFTAGGTGGPNILWVTTDTVSAGHLAPWGGRVPLPTLEGLGAVRVEQAYSNFPETALSHWSMFTGVLPEVHGNVPPNGMSRYAGPSIAELAHARGYATAAFIGGVTLKDESCGLSRGFDVYDDDLPAGADHRSAPEMVALAQKWIATQKGPWFAWVHVFDAHLPYTPTDVTRFDKDYVGTLDGTEAKLRPFANGAGTPPERDLAHVTALYDAEIAEVDAALQPLFGGLRGDEVVVVNADHGESFAHNYLFNHRAVLWDDVLHVPLYVKAPGLKPGAVSGMVGLVDLLPTVVDLAGWHATAPFMGVSRVAVLRGEGGGATKLWARTDPWMPLIPGEAGARFAELTPASRMIRELDGTRCTYDPGTDPGELHGECSGGDDRAWTEYNAAIQAMSSYQRAEVSRPSAERLTPGEMLEQLGYTDRRPGNAPPPPPPSPAGR